MVRALPLFVLSLFLSPLDPMVIGPFVEGSLESDVAPLPLAGDPLVAIDLFSLSQKLGVRRAGIGENGRRLHGKRR